MKLITVTKFLAGWAVAATTSVSQAAFQYDNTSFEYLFNNYRVSQAKILPWASSFWPFDGEGRGSGINFRPGGQTLSPAQKYDAFFKTGGLASKWEEENHSCGKFTGPTLEACKAWYGHCNGWTGAALYNPEPVAERTVSVVNPETGVRMVFNFMDLKALLSETWQDVETSFEGTGMVLKAGPWIFDPSSEIARQPSANNASISNYEAYWDVTPRVLFYALTNYIGIQKTGIAVERFTGSEIWNQPLVAYRLLPIRGNTNRPITRNGQSVYPVTMGVKIYWAADDVDHDFRPKESRNWSVTNPRFSSDRVPPKPADEDHQDRVPDGAYASRFLSFTLFFDAPVLVSPDGTKVLSAGKILGDGVWTHSDPKLKNVWYEYETLEEAELHPDFLWRPLHITPARYRNPHIDPERIYKQILKMPTEGLIKTPEPAPVTAPTTTTTTPATPPATSP